MTDSIRTLEHQALLDNAMELAAFRHRKRDHDMSKTEFDQARAAAYSRYYAALDDHASLREAERQI